MFLHHVQEIHYESTRVDSCQEHCGHNLRMDGDQIGDRQETGEFFVFIFGADISSNSWKLGSKR